MSTQIRRMADDYMIHVYYMFSAAISLDGNGACLSVRLFDTVFGKNSMTVHPDAACVCLLSNHPEGYDRPYSCDLENLAAIKRLADAMNE